MGKLHNIAKKAGLSVATVSRALNNSDKVNEKTKKFVAEIASEMNYTPGHSTRRLREKTTKTIGLIVPELISSYFAQLVNYIEAELKELDYSLIVGMTHHDYSAEVKYINALSMKKVDGIILAGSMDKEIEEQLAFIKYNYNIPMILIQTFVHYPEYDYITIDEEHGFNCAIELLSKFGHRDIGFIACPKSSKLRLGFFKSAMLKKGMALNNNFIRVGAERFELGGYLRMKELLQEKRVPTAVLMAYDNMAIGGMKAIYERGLRIPEDISVIGYDNIRESEYLRDPLTSISPPIKEMCHIGVKLLISKIEDKDNKLIQHVSLKPELIVRSTTTQIKQEVEL